MSRRTVSLLTVLVVAVGAVGLVLGAAGSAGAAYLRESPFYTVPRVPSSTSASSSSLTVALAAEPDGLDPALTFDGNAFLISAQIYETLISYAPNDHSPLPGLADAWSVSADGKVWTFNIPPNLKFSDGATLDAFAIAANFNRWWDPANPHHIGTFDYFGGLFGGFKGDDTCWLLNVEAPDAATFRLTLAHPNSALPVMLGSVMFGIASPAAFDTLSTQPVGSGPFKFANWAANDHIELIANPLYHGRAPQLSLLTFKITPDETARLVALQANQVQVAVDMNATLATTLITDANLRLLWRPSLNIGYLGINRAHGPLGNTLVRQAIAHAIDKTALIANHYAPGTERLTQYLPPNLPGFNATLSDYTYDPTLARSLLTQAGYPHGLTTTLALRNVSRIYLPDPVAAANAIAAELHAVGITATVLISESSAFLNAVRSGQTDLFLLGWGADYPNAENFFGPVLCDGYLAYGAKDTGLCNLIDQARATTDYLTQLTIYRAASEWVQDTLPVVPLARGQTLIVARREVAALWPSGMGTESYKDTYLIDPATSATEVVASGNPLGFDPALAYDIPAVKIVAQTYEPLLTYNRAKTDEFVPLLATDWIVSPDARTYTFTVRSGVHFHNGATLDAEDVAFSIWRGLLIGGSGSPQWLLDTALLGVKDVTQLIEPNGTLIDNRAALNAQSPATLLAACNTVKQAVTFNLANRTVTFHLPQAYGPFLNVMAGSWASIGDKAWLITHGPWDGNCATWQTAYNTLSADSPLAWTENGTGPYLLDSVIAGESMGVTRNPDYWRQIPMWAGGPSGPASIPHVTIKQVPDAAVRANMLLNGDADWGEMDAASAVTLSQHVMLDYDGADGLISTLQYPTGTLRAYRNIYATSAWDAFFVYDIASGGPRNYLGSGALDGQGLRPDFFTDLHARQAFNYAFDWTTFINEMYGGAASQRRGPIIKTVPGYRDNQPTYFYSPTLALQELGQAWGGQALSQGMAFTLSYNIGGNPTRQRFAELMKAGLENLSPNIHITVTALPWDDYNTDRQNTRLPMFAGAWMPEIPHASNWVAGYLTGVYADQQRLPADQRALYQAKAAACLPLSGTAAEACYADIQNTTYLSATDIFLAQSFATQFSSARLRGYYVNTGQWVPNFYALSKGDLPVIDTTTPTSAASIPFTSTSGTTANLQVPIGAVTQTTTIVAVPDVPAPDAPGGFQLGNLTFNLQAYVDNTLVPSTTFANPITLTLHYNASALGHVTESNLLLLWWNGSDWIDAACGPYQRDLINHVLTVPICHFSQFSIGGTVKVGLIVDGPTPLDGGFNELAYQGLQRAQTELGIVGTVYTTTNGQYALQFNQCVIDHNALCVGVGFSLHAAIIDAATTATTTKFALVDNIVNYPPENLRDITFAEDEAGYLAGVLAGKLTTSNVVGAVAGMSIPPVDRFISGYRHGVLCSNPYITASVLITYANTFIDPNLGAQIAQQQIAQRADVIFNIAGPTGNGAILTATQSGQWAIGVDADQYLSLFGNGSVAGSNKLLSSAMKRVDHAVFNTVADVISGTFTAGDVRYGLNNDGVGLAPFHGADGAVSPSVRNAIETARLNIINGTLDVTDNCRKVLYLPLIRK